jgi:hypothetical protein
MNARQREAQIYGAAAATIADGWRDFVTKTQVGDFTGAANLAHDVARQIASSPLAAQGVQWRAFGTALTDFHTAALKLITAKLTADPNWTKAEHDRVGVLIEGKERRVALQINADKLFAIGKNNQQEIKLTDIVPEDLRRLAPASALPLSATLGAVLYFTATPGNATTYRDKIATDKPMRAAAELAQNYFAGQIPLVVARTDLAPLDDDELSPPPGAAYEDFRVALTPRDLTLVVTLADGGAVKLSESPTQFIQLTQTDGELTLAAAAQSSTPTPLTAALPATAPLRIEFRRDFLLLKNAADTDLSRLPFADAPSSNEQATAPVTLPTWNCAILLTSPIRSFSAFLTPPNLALVAEVATN